LCGGVETLGIETFASKNLPAKINAHGNALIEESPKNSAENELAIGNPGSGKTHLVCPIALELVQHKAEVYDAHYAQSIGAEFACSQGSDPFPGQQKACYHTIIIDDTGYVQQSLSEMEVLFTLRVDRFERSTVTRGNEIKRKR